MANTKIHSTPQENRAFVDGCNAIIKIANAREKIERLEAPVRKHWTTAKHDEVGAVLNYTIKVPFSTRRQIAFLHARRCATEASSGLNRGMFDSSLRSLIDGVLQVSMSVEVPLEARGAAKAACVRLLGNMKHSRAGKIREFSDQPDDISEIRRHTRSVLGLTWEDLEECVKAINLARSFSLQDILPSLPSPRPRGAAESLSSLVLDAKIETTAPTYDRSDEKRRVKRVELTSFRGSPNPLTLDLENRGKPVSAIILGDNGSGKSTLVDAIEFALQGRVGRSVSFDSPLRPAAASLSRETPSTVVATLDDDTVVHRALTQRDDGKIVESGEVVRPGFRLAPITLKRQDILRFLDTAALSRGHVFFDYFPVAAEQMAIRPEELLERIDDEAYQLRIERTRTSTELADMLGVEREAVNSKDSLIRTIKDRLTGGLSLKTASDSGRWATVDAELRVRSEHLLSIFSRLKEIKQQRERGVEALNPVRYRAQAALLAEALHGIGNDLSLAFSEITGASYIRRIDVIFGGSGPVSLDLVIELASGKKCFPQQLFSEGYRDLLAVLFFAAVARRAAERGQSKVLILDDVFQSVDSTIRAGVVDYLLKSFKDWQLVFTVHDRLWFEQLRSAFRRAGHSFVERELRHWSFEDGPQFGMGALAITSHLTQQLASGDPATICGAAGRLLEQACDQLSWRIGSSVPRRREDKYTLGDLWPSIQSKLKKTKWAVLCTPIDQLIVLRNLVGAHYNEWADTLSLDEADRFGTAVLQFVNSVWCADCHDWISAVGSDLRCTGGHLSS